jgi:hypothetical protein
MNPNTNNQVQTPEQQPLPPSQNNFPRKSKKLPIFLILWPILLIPLLIVLNIIAIGIFSTSGDPFGTENPIKRIVDVFTFLGGAINLLLGLPSFIVGIILLVKRTSKS